MILFVLSAIIHFRFNEAFLNCMRKINVKCGYHFFIVVDETHGKTICQNEAKTSGLLDRSIEESTKSIPNH
jgi:hypothetical protein